MGDAALTLDQPPPNRAPNQSVEGMCMGKKGMTYAVAAEVVKRGKASGMKRSAYHCQICRQWHVGRNMGPGGRKRKMKVVK